jgi:GTPase SAR1 family protein
LKNPGEKQMVIKQSELNVENKKVLICGLDNAGKSSIQDILRFSTVETALRRVPSKEMEIFNKQFLKKRYVFFIPPGQEDLRRNEFHGTMKNDYFENVTTFIFVVDAGAKERLQEAGEELQRAIEDLLELSSECQNYLLFAHKQDLDDAQTSLAIKKELLDPLHRFFPTIVQKFKIFETTILSPETIHEPFVKAIAQHSGLTRVDFDQLAAWVRKQTSARVVLISDENGLLIGESYTGKENPSAYAAYMAKIFTATDEFQNELESNGFETILFEEGQSKSYSLISRIACSNDYLSLFIGFPQEQIGMTRIINRKGLQKLQEAYDKYQS